MIRADANKNFLALVALATSSFVFFLASDTAHRSLGPRLCCYFLLSSWLSYSWPLWKVAAVVLMGGSAAGWKCWMCIISGRAFRTQVFLSPRLPHPSDVHLIFRGTDCFCLSLSPPISSLSLSPSLSLLSLSPAFSVCLPLYKLVITNAAQNPEHNDLIQEDMLVWNGTLRLHDAHLGGRIHKGNIMWIVDR